MILNILRSALFAVVLCASAMAGAGHDHHGHDHGDSHHDEISDGTDALSALAHLQERLEALSNRYRTGEIPMDEYLHLREDIAAAAAEALPELEDRRSLGLNHTPLTHRFAAQLTEYIQHLNPVALGRWTMAILRKYGPGAAAGFIIMETSEQWAGYYALTGSTTWLRALAGAYSVTHAGDVLFALAFFGTPYVVNHLSWARYNFRYFNGNPVAYRDQLQRLRGALPIDWSLNPYVDAQGQFLVLDKGRWSNPRTWLRRYLPHLRHTLQAESFATVSFDDLLRIARRHRIPTPPPSYGFHAQTELLISGLRSTLEGTLDLDSLVITAQGRVTTTPASNDGLSDTVVAAERLRVALGTSVNDLEKRYGQLRHRRPHRMLTESIKILRRLGHQLENPALTEDGLRTQAEEAAKILAGLEEQNGLYRNDVTSNELAQRFHWDLAVAKHSLEFYAYVRLEEAQQEARRELAPLRFNSVNRIVLFDRVREAQTFWQLSEALRLIADAWPEDYRFLLNDSASDAPADCHDHGNCHGHGLGLGIVLDEEHDHGQDQGGRYSCARNLTPRR